MKPRCWIRPAVWAALLALLSLAAAAADPPAASAYFTLDNGLQVLLQEKRDLPLVAITLACDLGVKDEDDASSGYAHLLEHLLLFGDGPELDAEARLAELRAHGVEHNAHTDHDLMIFEASCPAAEAAWTLEQVRRTVFAPRFSAAILEREKRVIAEEILHLREDPDRLGPLLVMESLFAGHPYGRSLYGSIDAVNGATVAALKSFCSPRLVPDRCAVSLVGDFAVADMEREVRRLWSPLARGTLAAAELQEAASLAKSSDRQVELDVEESHLFIGWRAPAYNDPLRLPFTLLSHLLGGSFNPLLSRVLRGERPLANHVRMSYIPLRAAGIALLHVTLERRNIASAKNAVAQFLSRLAQFQFSPQDVPFQAEGRGMMIDYLQSAKNQIAYHDGQFRESARNLSVASARFLLLNRTPIRDAYLEGVEKVAATDLRRVASRILSGKKWALVAITPLAHSRSDRRSTQAGGQKREEK